MIDVTPEVVTTEVANSNEMVIGPVQSVVITTFHGENNAIDVKHHAHQVRVEDNAVTIVVETAEAEITVEAAEDNAVTIAEGTIADRLDEGRANRVAGVQKARAGPADAEISRGAFI